jgi:hypothetical protein
VADRRRVLTQPCRAAPAAAHTHSPPQDMRSRTSSQAPGSTSSADSISGSNFSAAAGGGGAGGGAGGRSGKGGRQVPLKELHAAVAELNREIDDKSLTIHEVLGQGAYGESSWCGAGGGAERRRRLGLMLRGREGGQQ